MLYPSPFYVPPIKDKLDIAFATFRIALYLALAVSFVIWLLLGHFAGDAIAQLPKDMQRYLLIYSVPAVSFMLSWYVTYRHFVAMWLKEQKEVPQSNVE